MNFFKKILRWGLFLIVGLALFSIVEVLAGRWIPVRYTLLMGMRKWEFRDDTNYKHQQKWVALNKISPYMIRAVVASEDNLFFQHKGFDWKEINTAIEQNKVRKRQRGASTISQQVAKNMFLWPGRTWLRKGLEVYYTVLIEWLWNKERIIEVYLNIAEMGKGIFGVEAAAEIYFKKAAGKLTTGEAALIAAALPNPLKRNPAKPNAYMQQRQRQILNLMGKLGPVMVQGGRMKGEKVKGYLNTLYPSTLHPCTLNIQGILS